MHVMTFLVCCVAVSHALTCSRRTFVGGAAAGAVSLPLENAAALEDPAGDASALTGLYEVQGTKARRRIVSRGGGVVVEAESAGGGWTPLESSVRDGKISLGGESNVGLLEQGRSQMALDCMLQMTYPSDSILWSDGSRWVRKRPLGRQ